MPMEILACTRVVAGSTLTLTLRLMEDGTEGRATNALTPATRPARRMIRIGAVSQTVHTKLVKRAPKLQTGLDLAAYKGQISGLRWAARARL